ncbi:MBL fold metallo-hydrolase [Vallitalea okinawensis]|uniref:MBL fold metallo-hydrolase n=1 Tax=Vallitalea okinawensis TaxID=2078660 RepID=UPI000CFB9272|nr:MBL fold metallo-hydrolase [Vallitalea okinawensis]
MSEDWFRVNLVAKNIYAIDDHGHDTIYLIVGSEKALIIDTGWGVGNLRDVISKITNLPVILVNTHGHPDHVSGDYQFDNVHICEDDIPILEGCFKEENRLWALNNPLHGPYPKTFSTESWIQSDLGNIIPIKSGHTFDLGNKIIEVIKLAGHTPGGIALLDKDEKILFSGDSIIKGDIWMHLDHSESLSTYLLCLENLLSQLSMFDIILPSHGEPIKPDIIYELIEGIQAILGGQKKGKPVQTFVGDGLLCEFANCGIVYNNAKL